MSVCECVWAMSGLDEGGSVTLIFYSISASWWKEPFLNLVAAAAQMSRFSHVEVAIGNACGERGEMKNVARIYNDDTGVELCSRTGRNPSYTYLQIGCSKRQEQRMLNFARSNVGKPFSQSAMARSLVYPRTTTGDSYFCAGTASRSRPQGIATNRHRVRRPRDRIVLPRRIGRRHHQGGRAHRRGEQSGGGDAREPPHLVQEPRLHHGQSVRAAAAAPDELVDDRIDRAEAGLHAARARIGAATRARLAARGTAAVGAARRLGTRHADRIRDTTRHQLYARISEDGWVHQTVTEGSDMTR
jgi:hypothetical protein